MAGLAACAVPAGAFAAADPAGAVASGNYRNLFAEYLGKSEAETEARLQSTWRQFVEGDPAAQRLVYRVPGDMAYIPDVAHRDVRTEGMSYGMMIAVQMDRKDEFDRLWRYAERFMYHRSGPFRGYFAWHTAFDGRRLSQGPAPDGEEWFAMALLFASHRWGDGGGILDYGAEGRAILHTMIRKSEEPDHGAVTAMFDPSVHQVVFVPEGPGARFTDPSYHLPAFYELWSRWADPADRPFLAQLAPASRRLLERAANAETGLMPDYSGFDGAPLKRWGHENFRYDAWRTLAYPALDYAWWAADPWEIRQSNRVLRFIRAQGPDCPGLMKLDGAPLGGGGSSSGMFAMAAVAALAADRDVGQPFVQRLWDAGTPEGEGRYYDGILTMLALLEVGGRFRAYGPAIAP